jgi:hypothetical protein
MIWPSSGKFGFPGTKDVRKSLGVEWQLHLIMTEERAELRTAGGASAQEFLATVWCKDTCGGYG